MSACDRCANVEHEKNCMNCPDHHQGEVTLNTFGEKQLGLDCCLKNFSLSASANLTVRKADLDTGETFFYVY